MDDLEFVQRCVKGDSSSWDEFLTRYSRLIYSYIHRVLGSKGFSSSANHIQDIFQELFSSLIENDYKKLRSYKALNGCTLASWLRQVTINFTLDYLRRIKPTISIDAEYEEGSSLKDILTDGSISVPELINQEEKLKSLKDCIEVLDNDEKYLLELNINQGVRLETLRKAWKISRGAIDMQKSRLMDKLRDCFKSKGF
ncbi:MAG: sigma-70 family RNA polymerase sigma factor [Candidatus Omnitrophica bacterium]|nr:sigma-70 family RNA polymerase sigma factor [Candidatus Omnitrophota bacterium]